MKHMLTILASALLCFAILAGCPAAMAAEASSVTAAYADTIKQIRRSSQNGSYDSWDLPVDSMRDAGYAFADLDADGSEELVVLSPEGVILFLYTLVDGQPTRVVNSTGSEYCTKIDESGSIYIARVDANKALETQYVYQLKDGGLSRLWQLNLEYDENGAVSRWQYQNKANRLFTLSEEEGQAMLTDIDAAPSIEMEFRAFSADTSTADTAKKYKKLQRGNKGEEVEALQTRLKELGYLEGEIDGNFGRGTRSAVEAFQADNDLKVDGVAGSETQRILFEE